MQTLDFCCLHASLCIYHWVAVIITFKVITHAFVFNRLLSPILSRHLCPMLACICIYVPYTSASHQQNAPEVRPRLQKQMWHTLRHLGHWDLRSLKRQKAQYSEFSTRHSTGKFIGFMLEQLEYLCSNCTSSSLLLSSCQSRCCLQPAHKPIPNKFQLISCLANHGHVSNHVSTQENGHVYRKHVQFSKQAITRSHLFELSNCKAWTEYLIIGWCVRFSAYSDVDHPLQVWTPYDLCALSWSICDISVPLYGLVA